MFTQETYKQIRLFSKFTFMCANLPFVYDEGKQQFECISGKVKGWYFFMLVTMALRVCYNVSIVVHNIFYGFPQVSDAALESFYCVGPAFCVFLNFGLHSNREDIIVLLNQLLVTNKALQSKFLIKKTVVPSGRHRLTGRRYSDGCSLLMKWLTPCTFISPISFGIMFILQPCNRIYFFFLIPGEKPFWLACLYFFPVC